LPVDRLSDCRSRLAVSDSRTLTAVRIDGNMVVVWGRLRLHGALLLLAVVAVLSLWTAESVWHEHADHADHHDCPVCQVTQHHGAVVVAPIRAPAHAPVCVAWLSASDTDLTIDEPCRSAGSPRGPPSSSLI
jgi:hypothetical protein